MGEFVAKKFNLNELTLERGTHGMIALLGLATWFLTFLAYYLSEVESIWILIWLISIFGIWLFSVFVLTSIKSVAFQYLSLALILGTPVFFSEANTDRWIPITVIALNLVGVIGFRIYSKFALILIALSVLIVKFLIDFDLNSFLYGGATFQNGWVSIGYLLAAGLVSYFLKSYSLTQAKLFDTGMTSRLEALEADHQKQIKRELNSSIARKMHESVLNTFTSIRRIHQIDQLKILTKMAAQDSKSLETTIQNIQAIPIQDLIQVAIDRSGIDGVDISLHHEADIEISVETLPALQDSLIEVFRNIDRHAKAKSVRIHWEYAEDKLQLTIQDDGIGFDSMHMRHSSFGLRVIANQELFRLGHKVSFQSKPDMGTKVIYEFREKQRRDNEIDEISTWPRLTQDNLIFRFLFLTIPVYVGLNIFILSDGFTHQSMVVAHYIFYLLVLSVYVATENTKIRYAVLPALVALIYWGQLSLINQTSDCIAALPIQWLVNGYTVGTIVIAISSISTILKSIILASNLLVQAFLSTSLGKCQEIVLLPALTGLIIAIGVIFGLNYLKKTNLNTIALYQAELDQVIKSDLRQKILDLTYIRLQSLTDDARSLLKKLQEVRFMFELDSLRKQIEVQEAFLRSALVIIEATSDDAQEALLQMLKPLSRQEVIVMVENWTDSLENIDWPTDLIQFGYELSNSLNSGTCKLSFFEQANSIYLVVTAEGKLLYPVTKYPFVTELTDTSARCEIELPLIMNTFAQTVQ